MITARHKSTQAKFSFPDYALCGLQQTHRAKLKDSLATYDTLATSNVASLQCNIATTHADTSVWSPNLQFILLQTLCCVIL